MHSATIIKKERFWPKNTKAKETVNEIEVKEDDTIRVRKMSCKKGENTNNMHLVYLIGVKHTSMMLTNWSDVTRKGDTIKKNGIGISAI